MSIKVITKLGAGLYQKSLANGAQNNLKLPPHSTTFIVGTIDKLPLPKFKVEGDGDLFVKAPVDLESTTKGQVKVRNANNVSVSDAKRVNLKDCSGEKNISKTQPLPDTSSQEYDNADDYLTRDWYPCSIQEPPYKPLGYTPADNN